MKKADSKFFSWFIIVIAIFSFNSAAGQFYLSRNFNVENGLSSPEVYGMLQDSKSHMWFATDMGVSRFNGYEFRNFSTENGLPDNTVFGFSEDDKNRIWFRSFSGKLSFFADDSIHTLPCNKFLERETGIRNLLFYSIYVDQNDTIWIGTNGTVLIKIAPPWNNNNVEFQYFPETGIYAVDFGNRKLVYGGHAHSKCSITVYDRQLKKLAGIVTDVSLPKKSAARHFGAVLTDGSYLVSFNNTIYNFTSEKLVSKCSDNTVFFLMREADNAIYSVSNNAVRIHNKNDLSKFKIMRGFSGRVFTDVLIDKENSLWFSTEGQGVYHLPFPDNRYYSNENLLSESKITCFAKIDSVIAAGLLNGNVDVIFPDTVEHMMLDQLKTQAPALSRINCFFESPGGNIYAADGYSTFQLRKGNITSCERIFKLGARKIIVSRKGLIVLRDRHIQFCEDDENFSIKSDLWFSQYVDDIFEDRRGTLWIAALNGLWKMEGDSLIYLGEKNKLLASRIVQITEDKTGRLWMAARGAGIIVKDQSDFFTLKSEDGLASNMCRKILFDSKGVLWVGSNNGLSRIIIKETGKRPEFTIDVFTRKHGLLSNEVNFILEKAGKLFLAHNNSITIFDPAKLKSNNFPPPVYIKNIITSKTHDGTDLSNIRYEGNFVKIDYYGISFKNQGSLEYKYKLEGLDTSWVSTSYTSVRFQSLSPGTYRFIVYAKNDDGYWSEKPAEISFTIIPAWWQNWLVRAAVLLLFGFLIFWLIKKRVDTLRRRELEKAELTAKIAQTELKALRSQMNPHFIFNAINSVQHFITSNDPVSSQRYLAKFARLIRYVVDNSKPAYIILESEIEALTTYIELEALRFEERFIYSIEIGKDIDVNSIRIPSMIIQPFVENAIWHGLMHKKNGTGEVKIKLNVQDDILKCTIEDNGIGRRKSASIKETQNIRVHKSVGMVITKERLDLIGQVNNQKMNLIITDLENSEGAAEGTRVEVFISLRRETKN